MIRKLRVREGHDDLTATELVTRIRAVLTDMMFLPEAAAVSYDGDRVKGGGSKSAPPPGVRFGRRDLRDLSLSEYWRDRFTAARGDVSKLEFFLYLAERDLKTAKVKQEVRDPHESFQDRRARIVRQYEGLSPLEAAVAEGWTEVGIRNVRLEAQVDPETGWAR